MMVASAYRPAADRRRAEGGTALFVEVLAAMGLVHVLHASLNCGTHAAHFRPVSALPVAGSESDANSLAGLRRIGPDEPVHRAALHPSGHRSRPHLGVQQHAPPHQIHRIARSQRPTRPTRAERHHAANQSGTFKHKFTLSNFIQIEIN